LCHRGIGGARRVDALVKRSRRNLLVNNVPPERIKRPTESLAHFSGLDMLRVSLQHVPKHLIRHVREIYWMYSDGYRLTVPALATRSGG
jgi:hypothetical protein